MSASASGISSRTAICKPSVSYRKTQTRKFWGEPIQSTGVIPVRPGDTILAHTIEIVGGRNGFTTSMRARSSIGRSCMSVCKCAGVGDVGYIARWTMEITNHSHATIELPVGLRVAQILFYEVGETDIRYRGQIRPERRVVARTICCPGSTTTGICSTPARRRANRRDDARRSPGCRRRCAAG